MEVLTGEAEAIYAYEAATSGAQGFAVVDLGSRTTEFVKNNNGKYETADLAIGYKVAWDDFYAKGGNLYAGFDGTLKESKRHHR